MKRIILIAIYLLPLLSYGQTVLKADSVSCTIGRSIFPPNSFRIEETTDSTFTIYPLFGSGFTPVTGRYSTFAKYVKDSVFTSQTAMRNWLKQNNFFVNVSGSSTIGGFVGGHAFMTGNGTISSFNITTNAGFIPSYFTLTTTTPITQNQLNRTITFPDSNTMRITFENAPLDGENTDYVWIVYK